MVKVGARARRLEEIAPATQQIEAAVVKVRDLREP
jgi:hypothetical protein